MIYIKEGKYYSKYYTSEDNNFICAVKGFSESVILHGISYEFDGIITPDKNIHFVLQSIDGELIYLKKENDIWKKFSLLKSRRGVQKITGIKLVSNDNELCVFYVISHKEKNLLVKHVFSIENMVKEPEILGVIDIRRDFTLVNDNGNQTAVIFKGVDNKYRILKFDAYFKFIKDEIINFENEILELNAIYYNSEIYLTYSVPKKNSVAIVFCKESNLKEEKIVTFGISRNSPVHILHLQNSLIIQWEENGMIMQAESFDLGKSFSKPRHLSSECKFAKVRQGVRDGDLKCNKCAVYNMEPFGLTRNFNNTAKKEGIENNLNSYKHASKEFSDKITNEELMEKLNEIKSDIDKVGNQLISMCSFFEKIKNFKYDIETPHSFVPPKTVTKNLTGNDIGEINTDNVKLFENTDIDDIMPDKTDVQEGLL